MQNLQFLIDMLTRGRKLHISILDLNGILNTPTTKIAFENVIHSKKFCDIAKSTEKGYRACLHCKNLANTKATTSKKAFCGHCLYGIYEVAMPVIVTYFLQSILQKNQRKNYFFQRLFLFFLSNLQLKLRLFYQKDNYRKFLLPKHLPNKALSLFYRNK